MALSPSLTRRRMLEVSGIGAVVLTVPLPSASAAIGNRPAPAHLRRSSYLGLGGRDFPTGDGPTLRLVSVDDLPQAVNRPALVDHDEAFSLTFAGPAGVESGIHQVGHPDLGPITLFLTPAGRASGEQRYEAIVDRTVRLPAGFEPEEVEGDGKAAAAAAVAAGSSGQPAPGTPGSSVAGKAQAVAARRLKVTAKGARRASGGVDLTLSFTGARLLAVEVRLLRQGRLHGKGSGLVKGGKASLSLSRVRRAPKGTYDLVLTATDRKGAVTTVTRSVKVK